MSERDSRRIIVIALGISLLLHVLLAGWLRLPAGGNNRPETFSTKMTRLQILPRIRVVAHTTPPPHVVPIPKSQSAPARHTTVVPVHLTAQPHGTVPVVSVAQTAPPTPAATAQPPGAPCRDPNARPAIAALPSPPDIPSDIRAAAVSGITGVLVHLNADGTVLDAAIVQTSGNAGLDQIGLAQAREARYAPALANCKPVAGDYTFKEKWVAW